MSKFEKYTIKNIKRSEIKGAEYNPRVISDEARKKLKRTIRKHGIVFPIVVNKQTGNIVGGHQRISILDELHKDKDYDIQVSMIDVDPQEEVEINIKLNNPSIMGEWDSDLLLDLKEQFTDIDFIKDLEFEQQDVEIMFGNIMDNPIEYFGQTKETKEIKEEFEKLNEINNIKKQKQEQRQQAREENKTGDTVYNNEIDYCLTIVFLNNKEKTDFLKNIKKPANEKYIKSSVLYDIALGKLNIGN